jgi:hypothetical protein
MIGGRRVRALLAAIVLCGCGEGNIDPPACRTYGKGPPDLGVSYGLSVSHHAHPAPADHCGLLTGAHCPSRDIPTYETFGRRFMQDYCLACHRTELAGWRRQGAPMAFNFDTRELCIELAMDIDAHAGLGPLADPRVMPPAEPLPTDQEREWLSQWIACGLP